VLILNSFEVFSDRLGHIFTVSSGLFDRQLSTKQPDDTLPGNAYYRPEADILW